MVYDNVKALCKKNGTSIAKVEKEAQIGNGTIGKWQSASPNVDTLMKVADVLGVEVIELLKS